MSCGLTLAAGRLTVGAAFPASPFDVPGAPVSGCDVELMRAMAGELGLRCVFEPFEGEDFEDIFAGPAGGGSLQEWARRRISARSMTAALTEA